MTAERNDSEARHIALNIGHPWAFVYRKASQCNGRLNKGGTQKVECDLTIDNKSASEMRRAGRSLPDFVFTLQKLRLTVGQFGPKQSYFGFQSFFLLSY